MILWRAKPALEGRDQGRFAAVRVRHVSPACIGGQAV
jgi:hypothetical protein